MGGGGVGTAPLAPAGHYPQGPLHRLTPLHRPNPTRDRSSIAAYQPPAGVQTHLGYGICGPAPMTTSTCSRVHVSEFVTRTRAVGFEEWSSVAHGGHGLLHRSLWGTTKCSGAARGGNSSGRMAAQACERVVRLAPSHATRTFLAQGPLLLTRAKISETNFLVVALSHRRLS